MAIEMESIINEFLEGSIKTVGKVPVINELNVSENGTYTAPTGVDGYSPVKVNVPEPVLQPLNINSNGTYTPPSGVDGYDEVVVNVPPIPPSVTSLNVTENGTYTPPTGVDGYDEVVVNVPSLTIDYLKNNTLVYDTNNTQYFNYDNNKTMTEGWYIASLSWYDYNQDRTVNTLFYYSGSGSLEIFHLGGGYNYQFNIYVNPTQTQFQLTGGSPFNCYCKLSKVINSQIYS